MSLPTSEIAVNPASNIGIPEAEFDFLTLLDKLIDSKWHVLACFFFTVLLGAAYAFLSQPVYQANTLIQVEESKPGSSGALGEAANLFEIRSPASAEIEVLRSRLVVGQAVDDLQLYVTAGPRRLPFIGSWLSQRSTGLSNPGVFGFDGYVTGKESISVSQLEVPPSLEGAPMIVMATAEGFNLETMDRQLLAKGIVGEVTEFSNDGANGRIIISGIKGKPGAHFIVTRKSRLAEIERLQRRLVISEKGRQSGVISVTLEGVEPSTIAKVLNAVGFHYVRQNTERKSAEAQKTIGFLNGYLPQIKKQLEDSEVSFNQFRNQNGTFDLGTEGRTYLDTTVKLQLNLLELQQKRVEQLAQFTSNHPNVQTLDLQIASLTKEIGGLNRRVNGLPNLEQELLRLTRDVKVKGELYLNLLNSSQQLRLVKEGKVGNVRVVDAPVVPEVPIAPARVTIIAISALIGFAIGVLVAFGRSAFNPGILDPADIEALTDLRIFATVPHSLQQEKFTALIKQRVEGYHLLAVVNPDDAGIESLRSLRTALQFALLDARNNIVLFTGPTPGIGKSFTSANFAAILGAGGKRVLLVDADMRKGHLHRYFGLQSGLGLSEVIAGSVLFSEAVNKGVAPGVDLLSGGSKPPNTGELLLSPSTNEFLQSASLLYDLVLVDTPPVLAVSDTQVLAPLAGTVFLLARANITTIGELQEATMRLARAGAKVKGVVFNDLDTSRRRYGGYGYKYNRYQYKDYKYGR